MLMLALPADIDVWTSETLNVAGPVATIIAMIAFIYWGLAREWLVTGAAHKREIEKLETTQRRELKARDDSMTAERTEHAAEVSAIRADYEAQLGRREAELQSSRADSAAALVRRDRDGERREAELQSVISGLRVDLSRMFAAWQITDDARERVTHSRLDADGETLRTVLEALRHSPVGDRMQPPHPELEGPPHVGTGNG